MPINHTSSYANLTSQQFEMIGKILVEWSNIEFLLGVMLSRLLFSPEFLARTFTDSISAVRLLGAISNALDIHEHRYGHKFIDSEVTDSIRDINKKIEGFRLLRNDLAHKCWTRENDDGIFGFFFTSKVPKPDKPFRDSRSISMTQLSEAHEGLFVTVEELQRLIEKIPRMEEEDALDILFPAQRGQKEL